MLTEVVMIEDRVLRFEKAKNALQANGGDNRTAGHNQNYESSAVGPDDYANQNASVTFFVNPPVCSLLCLPSSKSTISHFPRSSSTDPSLQYQYDGNVSTQARVCG